jgi:hypothetical protein
LLSYEEKTHAQVMSLVADGLQPDVVLSDEATPAALCNDLHGLRQLKHWLVEREHAWSGSAPDQVAMANVALQLEASEGDKVLHWLMHLPVDAELRKLIRELNHGTTGHLQRIQEFKARLVADGLLESISNS